MSKHSSSKLSQINKSKVQLNSSDYKKNLSELTKIKYPAHPIDQAIDLNEKLKTLKNETVKQEINQIAHHYSLNCYRRVRGDGNCFFRAIAFQTIVFLNQLKVGKAFPFLDHISLGCCYPESIPKEFQKYYNAEFLKKVLLDEWQKRLSEFTQQNHLDRKSLIKMFDAYPLLDFITMLYFRALCLKSLEENRNSKIGEFLCGNQEQAIRTYSEETEGIVVHLCSIILKINIHVFEVRPKQVMKYKYTCEQQPMFQIFMLFQDSHYDILEEYTEIESEKSALKSKTSFHEEINQKMVTGQCIFCQKKGDIYEENGLCLLCHRQSLANFVDLTSKDTYQTQRCSQCSSIKRNVSQRYKMCPSCLEIQKSSMKKQIPLVHIESSSSIHSNSSSRQYGRCALCRHHDYLNIETGICKDCLRFNKNVSNIYFKEKEHENHHHKNEPKHHNHHEQKKQNQKSEKFNIKGTCQRCKLTEMINEDMKICSTCSKNILKNFNTKHEQNRVQNSKQEQKNGKPLVAHGKTTKSRESENFSHEYLRWLEKNKN